MTIKEFTERTGFYPTYDREPLYESTDWNYVRFDVCGMTYEYVNGQLVMYCR